MNTPARNTDDTSACEHAFVGVMLEPGRLAEDAAAWFADQRSASIRRLVADGERLVRRRLWPHAAAALRTAPTGSVVRVPFALVRPGQAQLSYDHVRGHVVKFIDRLGQGQDDVNTVARENMPGIVGPDGRSVLLRDRNHNFAALLALIGWVSRQVTAGEWAPETFARLAGALDDEDGPSVAVRVQENLSDVSGRTFAETMRARLFIEHLDGSHADMVPDRFADLEDNPARELAAKTRVKVKRPGRHPRDFELSVKQVALWVKGPSAPEYVEFHVAKIAAAALAAAGRPYNDVRAVDRIDEQIMREALLSAAADPSHPSRAIFERIVIVPEDLRQPARLQDALEIDREAGTIRLVR